jgi:hypothetical protein
MRYAIVFLCFVSLSALGDEVRLSNGDRITGEVKEVTGERLIVNTDFGEPCCAELPGPGAAPPTRRFCSAWTYDF